MYARKRGANKVLNVHDVMRVPVAVLRTLVGGKAVRPQGAFVPITVLLRPAHFEALDSAVLHHVEVARLAVDVRHLAR